MNKLYLLSGPVKKVGWVTIDIRPGADYCCNIPPLPSEMHNIKWDRIELIHGIEHFTLKTAQILLKEIKDILSKEGLLVLEQPNVEYCAKRFLQGDLGNTGLCGIYGDKQFGTIEMAHKWGWTPKSLAKELLSIGFREVLVKKAQTHIPSRDFRIEAKI